MTPARFPTSLDMPAGLQPLTNNGGPTMTQALDLTSAAAMSTARRSACHSSRTFPGQACVSSTVSAPFESPT